MGPLLSLPASSTVVNMRGEGGRAVSAIAGRTGEHGRKREKSRRSDVGASSNFTAASTSAPLERLPSAPPAAASKHELPKPVVGWSDPPKATSRIVSAPHPSCSSQHPPPAIRSASTSSHHPAPRSRSRSGTSADQGPQSGPSRQSPIFEEDIPEEDEDGAGSEDDKEAPAGKERDVGGEESVKVEEEAEEPEIHLSWAIRDPPPRPTVTSPITNHPSGQNEEISFIRREMARMQLDMLRMNRDIKVSVPLLRMRG